MRSHIMHELDDRELDLLIEVGISPYMVGCTAAVCIAGCMQVTLFKWNVGFIDMATSCLLNLFGYCHHLKP